ncbi:MAG: hypothetical protein AB1393_05990 [Candidatus Edwardsbacteria bacterium]
MIRYKEMSRRKNIHSRIDSLLLGYTIPEVHQLMDIASKWLGPGHRAIGHSQQMLDFIESVFGSRGRKIALLHLLVDLKVIDCAFLLRILEE